MELKRQQVDEKNFNLEKRRNLDQMCRAAIQHMN